MNHDAPRFTGEVSARQIDALRGSFSGRLLLPPDGIEPFLVDWRKRFKGSAIAVAQPDTAQDVAAIVRWCAAQRVPVVPQGGNTGLVGGATPYEDGRALVLSLARMNRIRDVDPVNNTITVEAGCVLANLQRRRRRRGPAVSPVAGGGGIVHDRRQPLDERRRGAGSALRQHARAVPGPGSGDARAANSGTACADCARTTPATT